MPLPLIKELASGKMHGVVVAPRTPTYRNYLNLAPDFFRTLLDQYEGTRFGRQELHAEILEDVKGALWTHEMIEAARWPKERWVDTPTGSVPDLRGVKRKIVAVDPAGSTTGDEWGIVVCGVDNHRPVTGYVIRDYSQRGSPEDCAQVALRAYYDHGCEEMVAEVNFGAEMVGNQIKSIPADGAYPSGEGVRFRPVRAGRGQSKYERAVPVVGFFEQNLAGHRRVFFVEHFKDLEDQLTQWVPPEQEDGVEVFKSKWSPDRLDAMAWGLSYLMITQARRQGRSEGDALRSATI